MIAWSQRNVIGVYFPRFSGMSSNNYSVDGMIIIQGQLEEKFGFGILPEEPFPDLGTLNSVHRRSWTTQNSWIPRYWGSKTVKGLVEEK